VLCVQAPFSAPEGMVQVRPEQQSCDDWQAAERGWHASGAPHWWLVPSQISEQHSAAAAQAWPFALQAGPEGAWHAKPEPEARQEVPLQQVRSAEPAQVAPTGLQEETAAQVFWMASGVARTQGR
jgi:hypothetical protein